MQEKHLFEYAVIRIVPRVEREEFLNVGIILYCSRLKFLQMVYELNDERLKAFAGEADRQQLCNNLDAFQRICTAGANAGPIGLLDMPNRFRWLTATRSTIVQSSKVHPGFCTDPSEKLVELFKQLVL
ncbi:MAG: DUF3037 domain-containing protein [Sphingobacteriales bacterium]|nr:DUF3037 domain-containing protein [Sphingobacteriales bacterium]